MLKIQKKLVRFKIISQSAIASGVRRVEALRDKQLEEYEKAQIKDKSLKDFLILKEDIKFIKNQLKNLK